MTIEEWLRSIGLGEYSSKFSENHIDVDVLPCLTEADLIDLGVSSLGHRKRMMNEAKRFDLSGAESESEKKLGAWIHVDSRSRVLYWVFEGGSEAYILKSGKAISSVACSCSAFGEWCEKEATRKRDEFEDDSDRERYEAYCSEFLTEASFRLLNAGCLVAMEDLIMGKIIFLSAEAFDIDRVRKLVHLAKEAFDKLDWKGDSKVGVIGYSRSRIGVINFTECIEWTRLIELNAPTPMPYPTLELAADGSIKSILNS